MLTRSSKRCYAVRPAQESLSANKTGASLGIPLLTAWHPVHACGRLLGKTLLFYGATGAVGGNATQLAALSGGRVDAAANASRYGELLKFGGDVVIYGSENGVIEVSFRSKIVGFANLRFFIVYNLPTELRKVATDVLTPLLKKGALQHPGVGVFPLSGNASAHEGVESGANAKIIVAISW